MKKFKLIISITLILLSSYTYAQNTLTIDSLEKISQNHERGINVYVSAIWCLPCIEKLKYVSDSLEKSGIKTNNYILFDRLAFTKDRLRILQLSGFDSSNIFLIPYEYYSKKFIQINPSKKIPSRYIADLGKRFKVDKNGIKFWFGDMFTISSLGEVKLEKIQYSKK